jgi:GGDEF domain-containing protein
MHTLRQRLGDLTYEGTDRRTTVSVGVVIVRPDCHLTGNEIERAAAAAKKFAKDAGRNLLATYNSPLIQDGDLRIDNPVG